MSCNAERLPHRDALGVVSLYLGLPRNRHEVDDDVNVANR